MAKNTKTLVTIPLIDDYHVHLREGKLLQGYTKALEEGGCGRALVMPNLTTPITTCAAAGQYKTQIQQSHKSGIEFLMTLYLSPGVSVEDLKCNAARCGVVGVKSYPRGVTTNSESGIQSYEDFYPIFKEMEKLGLTLHLHGEMPSTNVFSAERLFLPQLHKLSIDFPALKIVLEHISSSESVEEIKRLSDNVAATVTAHHLDLTAAEVCGDGFPSIVKDFDLALPQIVHPHNFCKPIAKSAEDRRAIREVVCSGHPRFFLGSDSAPHPSDKKSLYSPYPQQPNSSSNLCGCAPPQLPAAGVFTSPYLVSYVADSLHRLGCLDKLHNFACRFGSQFFGHTPNSIEEGQPCIAIIDEPFTIPVSYSAAEGVDVTPYRHGQKLAVNAVRILKTD